MNINERVEIPSPHQNELDPICTSTCMTLTIKPTVNVSSVDQVVINLQQLLPLTALPG